jgi:hypothetical protein
MGRRDVLESLGFSGGTQPGVRPDEHHSQISPIKVLPKSFLKTDSLAAMTG